MIDILVVIIGREAHVFVSGDLAKELIAKHGAACSKDDCKKALRILTDSGRCVYSYLGGSYIQLPPKPGTEL